MVISLSSSLRGLQPHNYISEFSSCQHREPLSMLSVFLQLVFPQELRRASLFLFSLISTPTAPLFLNISYNVTGLQIGAAEQRKNKF